jgi:hypothetical protein
VSKSGQMDKPFVIPKQLVWEAYRRVKANKGAAGVDRVSVEAFEEDLRGNLYKMPRRACRRRGPRRPGPGWRPACVADRRTA